MECSHNVASEAAPVSLYEAFRTRDELVTRPAGTACFKPTALDTAGVRQHSTTRHRFPQVDFVAACRATSIHLRLNMSFSGVSDIVKGVELAIKLYDYGFTYENRAGSDVQSP